MCTSSLAEYQRLQRVADEASLKSEQARLAHRCGRVGHPGRQFSRFLQRSVPGKDRRGERRQLCLLALVGGVVAVAMIIVIRLSPERRGELLHAH
jgi:hypothetical protein